MQRPNASRRNSTRLLVEALPRRFLSLASTSRWKVQSAYNITHLTSVLEPEVAPSALDSFALFHTDGRVVYIMVVPPLPQ